MKSSIFSDHNAMTLQINCKKKTAKNTNMWRLNSIVLNNQWILKKSKWKSKNNWRDKWKQKYSDPKSTRHSKSSSKREVIAIQSYLRKQIKSQINNLILHLKNIIKKVRRRKEIINIRAEINEIENKKIENINKTLNR